MLSEEQMKQLESLAHPLVKFIADNFDPHTEIIIDYSSVRILSGLAGIPIEDYIH